MRIISLVLFLLCGCRYLDQKIIKDSAMPDTDPRHAVDTKSFVATSKSEPELVISTQPTKMQLNWDIPEIDDNGIIMFEVDKTDSISNPNWVVYCYTNKPPVEFDLVNESGYFRVTPYYK